MNRSSTGIPINIRWNRSELALVMNAVVKRPFYEVFKLVGELSRQSTHIGEDRVPISLCRADLKICLMAIRESPNSESRKLITDLNMQLTECGIIGGNRG